jgi:hypothetical protein
MLRSWMLLTATCIAQSPQPTLEASEVICGPRCVQRVLEDYGQCVELIDLVRELQGAAIDRPASLLAMSKALERRGIYTAAIRISGNDVPHLNWREPVIVHIATAQESHGHFVVMGGPGAESRSVCLWASSAEFVGQFRLRQGAERVI